MLVHRRDTYCIFFARTHLNTWTERATTREKYLDQKHRAVSRSGLEPGLLDSEYSALTISPQRLPALILSIKGEELFYLS